MFAMNVEQVKGLLASIPGEEIELVVLDRPNIAPDHEDLSSRYDILVVTIAASFHSSAFLCSIAYDSTHYLFTDV